MELKIEIETCSQCPHYTYSKEGAYCYIIEKRDGPYEGMIWKNREEPKSGISPKCPFLKK